MDFLQIVLPIVGVVLGIGFIGAKVEKVLAALVAVADIITVGANALSDKQLTADEVESIKKEVSEAVEAFKNILK